MKIYFTTILIALLLLFMAACGGSKDATENAGSKDTHESTVAKQATSNEGLIQSTDSNGYTYSYLKDDPYKARIYTLENGLTVYLSENKDEPRISTYIAVKAGSKFDPPETTGLAHYLEHMMFKGSDEIGTTNWDAEKVLLDQISDLFEKHRQTDDPEEKKEIYAQIDALSQQAAQYAIPNEYDKLTSVIGAKETNAYTSVEETVYMNDIPANELERWLILEKERFGQLVLRLFHTELETVYEEFNQYQTSDNFQVYNNMLGSLFTHHPYGTQTTIGKAEHLKNPSMVNIHNYWNTYYIPNNMAICLAGDLDIENTIQMIDKHWGSFDRKELPDFQPPTESPIAKPTTVDMYGPESEFLWIGFRFDGAGSEDHTYVSMIDMLLSNSQAGLIDINLVQEQKILRGGSFPMFFDDYGMYIMTGYPREGQSLDEVKNLLLGELEKIKNGDFEPWLMEAVINNMRLHRIEQIENNRSRAASFVNSFVRSVPWNEQVAQLDKMAALTKEDIVAFANEHFQSNYIVLKKNTGQNPNIIQVEKPEITPISINRDSESDFMKSYKELPSLTMEPQFIDFEEAIQTDSLSIGIPLKYIHNTTNSLFKLAYVVDMGKRHNKKLALAVSYLPYLGTETYTAAELQQELYRLGLKFDVSTDDLRSYIYITGVDQSLEEGLELLEHIMEQAKADPIAYDNFVQGILKKRADAKLNKQAIMWGAMMNFAKYGEHSPFTNILPKTELEALNPEELVALIHELETYEHYAFYYGPSASDTVQTVLEDTHSIPENLKLYPNPEEYTERSLNETEVYFVHYDTVQVEVLMMAQDQAFNAEWLPPIRLFNEYYGSNMSSIVFQELRESKALAYMAFSGFSVPRRASDSHYVYSFIGTQPDKLADALVSMNGLMNTMAESPQYFALSKGSLMKKIETDRIIKDDLFWTYLNNLDLGMDYDYRRNVYQAAQTAELEDIKSFFQDHVANKTYTIMVLGDRNVVDLSELEQYGAVQELSLETLFSY